MSDLTYRADGLHVEPVTSMGLVCEQHPDRDWPHGDCAGPGCPPEHRTQVLSEALRDIRVAATFGDETAARWLAKRGIAEHPWKDDR